MKAFCVGSALTKIDIIGLSDIYVNCSTINNFKSKIKVELEPELYSNSCHV